MLTLHDTTLLNCTFNVALLKLSRCSVLTEIFISDHVIVNGHFLFLPLNQRRKFPGDVGTKVKQINGQSDLIYMSSFAGKFYLTIKSSVYIILI